MAGQEGFEPPTGGFGDRCSSSWSYWPSYIISIFAATVLTRDSYFSSLCNVCFLQNLQYLLSSILSLVFFLFLQEV